MFRNTLQSTCAKIGQFLITTAQAVYMFPKLRLCDFSGLLYVHLLCFIIRNYFCYVSLIMEVVNINEVEVYVIFALNLLD